MVDVESRMTPAKAVTAGGFWVHLQRSAVTLGVGPAETLAEVLIRAGADVRIGCGGGGCGTCMIDVDRR